MQSLMATWVLQERTWLNTTLLDIQPSPVVGGCTSILSRYGSFLERPWKGNELSDWPCSEMRTNLLESLAFGTLGSSRYQVVVETQVTLAARWYEDSTEHEGIRHVQLEASGSPC